MAGAGPGAIMDEDYFASAAEWGDEADGGQVSGGAGRPPTRVACLPAAAEPARRQVPGARPVCKHRARPPARPVPRAPLPGLRPWLAGHRGRGRALTGSLAAGPALLSGPGRGVLQCWGPGLPAPKAGGIGPGGARC